MKTKKSILPQFLIGVLVASFGLSALCAYAIDKAQAEDPGLTSKIEAALQKHYDNKNIHFNIEWDKGSTQKSSQTFALPVHDIHIRTTSGDIQFKTVKAATEVTVKATGGKSHPNLQVTSTKDLVLEVDKTFGKADIVVEIPESFSGALFAQSVSGDIHFSEVKAERTEVETVSGSINLEKISIPNTVIKTISGDINLDQESAGAVVIDSISGDAHLELSKATEGFEFDIKTVSGSVENKVDTRSKGNTKIQVSTASGDIEIQ